MRILIISYLSLVSATSFAAMSDRLQCRVNLKRGIETQAFQLNQTLTPTRKTIPFPLGEGHRIDVVEGELPFEIFLGWDKISAKITYRFASLKDDSGKIIQASHWNCFEGLIETSDGLDTLECGYKNEMTDPFSRVNSYWQPALIRDDRPMWPEGQTLQGKMMSGYDTLTVVCKVL